MFYPCGYPQRRVEGICIGSCHRAEMGFAGKRDNLKRPDFPDYMAYVPSPDKGQYPYGTLADRDSLGAADCHLRVCGRTFGRQ